MLSGSKFTSLLNISNSYTSMPWRGKYTLTISNINLQLQENGILLMFPSNPPQTTTDHTLSLNPIIFLSTQP